MADRVLPIVRLLFPCDAATFDTASGRWTLTNPWAVLMLPTGATFPFDHGHLWLYAQLTEGVGAFNLGAELRLVLPDGSRPVVESWTNLMPVQFPGGQQLQVFDTAFRLTEVPFERSGIYEFGLLGNYAPLQGRTVQFRVLDGRDKL